MAVWCLSNESASVTCLCVCFKVCTRSHSCVSRVPIDIHQKCNLSILSHKGETEKVSFFLVYIILITRVDLDLAKKSSDVVFQKEPLVWIVIGQLWEGVKVLRCVLVHTTNSTIPWCHRCIIAKYICSNKLSFTMTSLEPMVHCLYNIRPAFISYNALQGINLPIEYNEVPFYNC